MNISWDDFEKVVMRVGTITHAQYFPKAVKPSYKLTIDFGNHGIKQSSGQITHLYSLDNLVGKQVVAVVNFPPKQIADFFSECLILGVYNENNQVVLLQPERQVQNGGSIG